MGFSNGKDSLSGVRMVAIAWQNGQFNWSCFMSLVIGSCGADEWGTQILYSNIKQDLRECKINVGALTLPFPNEIIISPSIVTILPRFKR